MVLSIEPRESSGTRGRGWQRFVNTGLPLYLTSDTLDWLEDFKNLLSEVILFLFFPLPEVFCSLSYSHLPTEEDCSKLKVGLKQ